MPVFGTTGEGAARVKFTTELIGFDRVALKLAMIEPEVRQRVVTAIEQTTGDVLAEARSRVPVLSGELKSTLRRRYTKSGLTGFVEAGYGKLARKNKKGEKRRSRALRGLREGPQLRGIYAAVVEFGSKTRPARPYLVPAVEATRKRHYMRIARAVLDGLKDVAGRK